MTQTIKLTNRLFSGYGYSTGQLSIADDNNISLLYGGWIPGEPASTQEDYVIESLQLRVKGTGQATLAANIAALTQKINEANEAALASAERYVSLDVNYGSETLNRMAYIFEASGRPAVSPFTNVFTGKHQYTEYTLVLRRQPYWEAVSSRSDYEGITLNSIGGTSSVSTTYGDVGARVYSIDLDAESAMISANVAFGKFWIGIKTNRNGLTLSNFQSFWSLRKSGTATYSSGGFDADTTGDTTNADATAKDGYKTVTTFSADATLITRAKCTVMDVTTNENDQQGAYTVLLRAKNSTTGTTRVRLADGWKDNLSPRTRSRVEITSSSWQFYELGNVVIPTPKTMNMGVIAGGGIVYSIDQYTLAVQAERTSGSCNLEMDCLVLIPSDEYQLYLTGSAGGVAGAAATVTNYQELPGGISHSISYTIMYNSTATTYYNVPNANEPPTVSGSYPAHMPRLLVMAAQRESSSVLADDVELTRINYYPRYRTINSD